MALFICKCKIICKCLPSLTANQIYQNHSSQYARGARLCWMVESSLSLRETGQHRSFIYSWTFFTHLKVMISWLYSRVIALIFKMKKRVTRGRDILFYISYIGFCNPIGVGFLRRFGLKTGIRFAHFGLGSGMVFEGTTEWIWIFFCFRSNLCNYKIISAYMPGLKTDMEN